MEVKSFSGEIPVEEKKGNLWRWLKIGIWVSLVLLVIGLFTAGGVLYYFSQDLPPLDSAGTYVPSQATRIYSDKNEVIGQYFIEKRVFVPIEEMPRHLIQAILAVEDARFYEHSGFDPIRIIRAFLKNIESGQIRQGASTITQQVTRSLFLTPERTIQRKIKELILSRKMELMLTKDEILEIYLNQIYFGHGAYGVQVASKTYFGKSVSDISLEEAAFLAGLPKAPNNYSPYRDPERAKLRQRVVLKRMSVENYITEQAYREAYEKDLVFQKLHPNERSAQYFKEYVRQYLINRYGDDVVYKGGLNVYTTLNEEIQQMAENAMQKGLRDLDKRQGYRGPIRIYDPDKVEDSKPVYREQPFKVGDFHEARVLSRTEEHAVVEVEGHVGKILLKDMLWAARQLTGPDIRKNRKIIEKPRPRHILKVDDIVQVQVKQAASQAAP
ncbi:MAG: transglycosylase domain-containing protein, partial [Nitrospiria bacterium]